ncbi:5-hydroxytryptamine receptor 3A-like [Python bivittatus]|uniref:5-hydroxytryptamine receptor 3A-like n=1 Tax=Python bivittatus TaxID=176946 RepID=A0A9F5MSI3_PYTBI|nr:5-hydroxytryptamine receptor 3A-like [Python bivittatus]
MRQICKYHDVVEYLNISSKQHLLLYSIPRKNWEESLEVDLDFTLISILSVTWKNEFISWNPLDFCNISSITLPVNLFWIPDIFIHEQADENKYSLSPFVEITSDGFITSAQAHQLTSSCNLDVHMFPFDEQKCSLTLSSSLHSEKELKMKNIKTSNKTNQDSYKYYLTSGEWKFEKVIIVEQTLFYKFMNFSTVIYEIVMKRRSILHELVLILPTFVLFLLDMAISYAFASPAEKIAFKVTMILQVLFLSMMLNDKLPATSDYPPVIAMFFIGIFAFMVLGILENAFVVYLKERKSKFPSFKTKNFIRRFLRKEKEKIEDSVTDVGEEILMENKPTTELPLAENDNTDSLVLLKQLNMELQQMKKHLVLEESKIFGPAKQDKLLQLENYLYYSRLILSLSFIAFIAVQWTQ